MNQNQRSSRSFFLIMNFHAADVGKFAVFGMRNCRFQFVKRNIRRTRKPENRQRDCQNRNERKQNFQKFFQHLLILTLLILPTKHTKKRKILKEKTLFLSFYFRAFRVFRGQISLKFQVPLSLRRIFQLQTANLPANAPPKLAFEFAPFLSGRREMKTG